MNYQVLKRRAVSQRVLELSCSRIKRPTDRQRVRQPIIYRLCCCFGLDSLTGIWHYLLVNYIYRSYRHVPQVSVAEYVSLLKEALSGGHSLVVLEESESSHEPEIVGAGMYLKTSKEEKGIEVCRL